MKQVQKLGIQLLTLKKHIKTYEDMEDTFRRIKNMGYDVLYINDGGVEYRQIVDLARAAGLEIMGTTYDFKTLLEDTETVLENCSYSGSYSVGVYKEVMFTNEVYERFCERANLLGKKLSEYGGKLVYNHHAREFSRLSEGKTGMEILKELLDPMYTGFAVNTFWLQNAGMDTRKFISDMTGRIEILRMQDAGICMDYLRTNPALGKGNMYWEGIMEASRKADVKSYIVENEKFLGNIMECLEESSRFIHEYYM